jgi:hypothetical protein
MAEHWFAVEDRRILCITEEGYQASVETGACASCGKMAEWPRVFDRISHRLGSLRRFNLCTDCFKFCWQEEGDGSEAIEFEVSAERVFIRKPRLKNFEVCCPTCQRTTFLVRRDVNCYYFKTYCLGACCHAHEPTSPRAQARLAERQDRKCLHCHKTFTPKNSLGVTCSGRCRVALHRQNKKEEEQDTKKANRNRKGK